MMRFHTAAIDIEVAKLLGGLLDDANCARVAARLADQDFSGALLMAAFLSKKEADAALQLVVKCKDAELAATRRAAELQIELATKAAEAEVAHKKVELAKLLANVSVVEEARLLEFKQTADDNFKIDMLCNMSSISGLLVRLAHSMASKVGVFDEAAVPDILSRVFDAAYCSRFNAYLNVCATDNNIDPDEVRRDGSDLYAALGMCSDGAPIAGDAEGLAGRKSSLLALAALAAFNGRDLALYLHGAPGASAAVASLRIRLPAQPFLKK